MNKIQRICFFTLTIITMGSCESSYVSPFLKADEPFFSITEIFDNGRFPNVVISKEGTIIATWGNENFTVRRSIDGGNTWGTEIMVAASGISGGGVIVDERNGDLMAFVEENHPPAPLHFYRSIDDGESWREEQIVIYPDLYGNVPSMHMNEHGITLKFGDKAGRLIRPSRFYGEGNLSEFWPNHYANAIYSDDGGKTWFTSEPFPTNGTGEAVLEELENGTVYYNSRRHFSTNGLNPRMRHIAWSYDSGETWEELSVSEELPDGDTSVDYGLMAGLVRLPIQGEDVLLFSNIESNNGRRNGTIWASFDGGQTWPLKKVVYDKSFAYSSLYAGRDGTATEGIIYLMFESDGAAKIIRFNMAWLMDGKEWSDYLKG
jgi:sialidase-1